MQLPQNLSFLSLPSFGEVLSGYLQARIYISSRRPTWVSSFKGGGADPVSPTGTDHQRNQNLNLKKWKNQSFCSNDSSLMTLPKNKLNKFSEYQLISNNIKSYIIYPFSYPNFVFCSQYNDKQHFLLFFVNIKYKHSVFEHLQQCVFFGFTSNQRWYIRVW